MVREHGELTNDPEKLFRAFNQEDLKSNFGIVQRTPEIAKEIIFKFYSENNYFKRLTLAYRVKNRFGSQA